MTSTNAPSVVTPGKTLPNRVVLVRKRGPGRLAERVEPASREAQRFAAAILEVLAGVRTPTDAAVALSISVPRYYLWEQRALAGLVTACEPRAGKRGSSWQHQLANLEKEISRLKQDCARQQALVRAAQRTIGLTAPPPTKPGKPVPKAPGKSGDRVAGKRAKRRRPMVRALKAVAALRAPPATDASGAADSSGSVHPEVVQQAAMERTPTAASALTADCAALSGLQGG